MRKCFVSLITLACLSGCASLNKPEKAVEVKEQVRGVVQSISEPYSERGGAAKYAQEQQHMLALRPALEGTYVKLEPKGKAAEASMVEFKLPPPKTRITESKSQEITVFFKFNSFALNAEAADVLKKAASMSPDYVKVSVDGFADSKGRVDDNLVLSKRRAEAVAEALVANGVKSDRIASDGFGSEKSVEDNESLAGRARNRRVEVRIVGVEREVQNTGK